MRSALICLAMASSAAAQDAMTGAAFQSFTEGGMFAFSYENRAPYGTEHYLSNRQVIWVEDDGSCWTGRWFVAGDMICFRYDNRAGTTCSQFYQDGDNMIVIAKNAVSGHRAIRTRTMLPSLCEVPSS